jgi:hypothetical protein
MLLDSLQEQLKVPADKALSTAERLLDAKLQCSLGGTYVLEDRPDHTAKSWNTTAWPDKIVTVPGPTGMPRAIRGFDSTKSLPPEDYKAPWLEWFRGANFHLTQLPERLVVVGTIDIEPIPVKPTEASPTSDAANAALPKMNMDLFSLPFQFFQGDKPKHDKPQESNKEKKAPETRKSF